MTELAFPDITDAAAVAVVQPAALDLAKVDLTDAALAQFGDWKADVAKVRKNLGTLALDLSTQAKVDEAKSLRHRLIGQPRAEVRKVSKALKSKLTAVSKAVGAMEDAAVAAYDDAETLITPQIDKRQGELDAEREEKARIERERVAALQVKLDGMQNWVTRCHAEDVTAQRIKDGMNALSMAEFPEAEWQELRHEAIVRRAEVLKAMQAIYERKLIAEADARRLEEQRAEAARIQALLDARQKELDAQAAEIKRQADELAAQRAESERQAQEVRDAAEKRMALAYDQARRRAGDDAPYEVYLNLSGGHGEKVPLDKVDEYIAALNRLTAAEVAEVPAFALVATPEGDRGPAVEPDYDALEADLCDGPVYDLGEPTNTTGEPSDQTPAEIRAADGPEVDLPPLETSEREAVSIPADALPAVADEAPTLKLGQIADRLGFALRGDFISRLGIEPAGRDKAAVLYRESQWPLIKAALIHHVERLS